MNDGIIYTQNPAGTVHAGDPGPIRNLEPQPLAGPMQFLRLLSQILGLLLVLVAGCYAVQILFDALRIAGDPTELDDSLSRWVQTLQLEQVAVPVPDGKVPLGRSVAGVLLLSWYALGALIALSLVSAGGKLVLGVIGERREFLGAMREFLLTMRTDGARWKK